MNNIDTKIIKNDEINTNKLSISNDDIVRALKTVFDPEIPVDIYELGRIMNNLIFNLA